MKKWQKKTPPKIRLKASGRTALRPTRKNDKKSMILKGFCKKKRIWRKNRKKCDFKGLFGQKNKNSMSRFCTLLALHFYWHFGCFKNEFLLGKYRTHGPLYSNDSRVLDLRFYFLILFANPDRHSSATVFNQFTDAVASLLTFSLLCLKHNIFFRREDQTG